MRLLAVGAAVVAFLAVSAVVARVIAAGAAARSEATDAVGGRDVDILRVDGVGGFAPGGRTETGRIAWQAKGRLPVVQCVTVRRTGDPLRGYDVAVLRVSAPIGREAGCPG